MGNGSGEWYYTDGKWFRQVYGPHESSMDPDYPKEEAGVYQFYFSFPCIALHDTSPTFHSILNDIELLRWL